MTKRTSALPPDPAKPISKTPSDASISLAKRGLIDAFYDASPARVVEKHPWLSITATASATLTATVIAHAPLSRKIISSGLMQTLRSALPMIQAFAMQRMAQPNAPAPTPPTPDNNNAMG